MCQLERQQEDLGFLRHRIGIAVMTSWSDTSQETAGLSELDKTGMAATIPHFLQPIAGNLQQSQVGDTGIVRSRKCILTCRRNKSKYLWSIVGVLQMERGNREIRSDPYSGHKKRTSVYLRSSAPSGLCITKKDSKPNEKCRMQVAWSKERAPMELPKESIIILRRFLRAIKDFDSIMKKLKEAISNTKEECISNESSRVLDCIGDLSSIVHMLEKKIQDVLRRSISEEMSVDILMEHTKANIKEELNLCQKDVGLCLEMTQKMQKDDTEFQELIERKEILQMGEMIACYENLKNMVISLQQALERDRNELKYTADNQQEFRLMIQAKIRENETLRQSNVKYSRDVKAKEQKIKDMLHKLSSLQHSATNKDIRVNVAAQTKTDLKLTIAEKNIQIIKLQKDIARYKCCAEKEQARSKRLTKEKKELENKLHDTQNILFSSTSETLNTFKKTSLSNEVITLKRCVEEKNKTLQAMMNAKAELELQMSILQTQVDEKNKSIANLENAIQKNRCNYEEVSSLKETLEQLSKTAAKKDEIIKTLQSDIIKQRKEMKEYAKRIQSISHEKLTALEKERNASQARVKVVEETTEVQQLIEKTDRLKQEMAAIVKERDFLRNENSILLTETEKSIDVQAKRAKEESADREQKQQIQEDDEVTTQRQNPQDLKDEANCFQDDKGDTERNQREKIRTLEKHRKDLMDDKLNIGKQLTEKNKSISDLREALPISRSNILKLGQMIKALRMEAAANSREKQSLQENIVSLKESFAVKQQERKALGESISKIKEENEAMKEQIELIKEENEKIKEENEAIKEVIELIKEVIELIKENETIKEENDIIKEENKGMKEENQAFNNYNLEKHALEGYSDSSERQKRESETQTTDITEFHVNAFPETPENFCEIMQKLDSDSEDYLDKCLKLEKTLSQKDNELMNLAAENLHLKESMTIIVKDTQEKIARLEQKVSDQQKMIMDMKTEKDIQQKTLISLKEYNASNLTKNNNIKAQVCILEEKIRTLQVQFLNAAEENDNILVDMCKLQERISPILCDNDERLMNLAIERKVIMDNIRSLKDVIKKCEDSMLGGEIVEKRNQLAETISMLQQRLRVENEHISMIMNQCNAFLEELQMTKSEIEKKKEAIRLIEREKDELSINLSIYDDQLLDMDEAWKKTEKCMQILKFSKDLLKNVAQLVEQGKSMLHGDHEVD